MDVYFLDVGQGTSNIILTGDRRAIVIDTGRRASDLRLLLNHLNISEIECLIVSHLDADHVGGASAILTEFRKRISKIIYPNDHRTTGTPFWQKLCSEWKDGYITSDQLIRLEFEDTPKQIWFSAQLQAELKILSPSFGQNQLALGRNDANATSGVLVLTVGGKRIVFSGDAVLDQWKEIRENRKSPLPCDVMAVPHHAGVIWPAHWKELKIRSELSWLYSSVVQPTYAIVSAGTSNKEGHPRWEVMEALRNAGVKILCTQITRRCSADLENLRPGVIPLALPGRSRPESDYTAAGNSRDLACAGTVVAEITPDSVIIRRWKTHFTNVNKLAASNATSPLCR